MVCNIFCVVGGDNVCPWCMFSNKIFVSRITKSMVAFLSWNLMISRLWMLVPRVCTAIGHRGFTRLCLHRGTHYSICFAILICLSLTSAVCWRLHCSADGFYRAMLCIRGTSRGPVSVRPSVRPSVCLSVTSRSSTKTAKRRITQTTPHDSPGTLIFWCQRPPRNSTGVTPCEGAECRWGGSQSATFDQ